MYGLLVACLILMFGHKCSVWVARRPPGYAFIEFDDRRDALDAIQALDGKYALLFYQSVIIYPCLPSMLSNCPCAFFFFCIF